LPLANPSHCRADSGLSPYRTCAHRAHTKNRKCRSTSCFAYRIMISWRLGPVETMVMGKPISFCRYST
jgi:hypothetical protein